MQTLLLALILTQPPAVPAGPPAVPTNLPAVPMAEKVAAPKKVIDFTRPCVVFAGHQHRAIPGLQVARDDSYDDGVYVVMPGRRWFRVDPEASDEDIMSVIRHREVQPSAVPFDPFSRSNKRSALREALDDASGRWPTMGRLEGMERYEPAQVTQSIFKFAGNPNGIIRGVSRADTEDKYRVPGGLVGVKGWRSELYRYIPVQPKQWHGMIGVKNSARFVQHEAAFQRSYPDDTEFDDVLVNTATGRVFEHRIAQKVNGRWERFVAYKDPQHQPAGYVPPKSKDCAVCHSDAAKGNYGVGLPSGADEIFSDPFHGFPRLGEEQQIVLR